MEAELFDKPLVFTDDVKAFPLFMANQRQLLAKRRSAQTQDIAALNRMLSLVRQELTMNQPLLEYGDVSRSEVLRLERSVADIEGQIANRKNIATKIATFSILPSLAPSIIFQLKFIRELNSG